MWVLTGDKLETAISIGTSCRLLSAEMEPLLIVDEDSFEGVQQKLEAHLKDIQGAGEKRPYGLVVTGKSLPFPLPPSSKERKDMIEGPDGRPVLKWDEARLAKQK